jgi:small GTP-binding protein
MNEIRYIFKVTVAGEARVGKTSLIQKFTQSNFTKEYIKTIGAQLSIYDDIVNGDEIKLQFWDIAGQDTFHFLRPSFFNNSKAAIIVYSLEENRLGEESFKLIPDWYNEIKRYCGEIPIMLFANKVDLVEEDNIDDSEILEVVNKYNLLGYYMTSAKTGKRVIEAFNAIIKELHKKYTALSAEL